MQKIVVTWTKKYNVKIPANWIFYNDSNLRKYFFIYIEKKQLLPKKKLQCKNIRINRFSGKLVVFEGVPDKTLASTIDSPQNLVKAATIDQTGWEKCIANRNSLPITNKLCNSLNSSASLVKCSLEKNAQN